MQFSRDTSEANLIHAWESGRIRVAERWIEGHVIVAADRVLRWEVLAPRELGAAQLEPAIELGPEVILVGTGTELLLPDVGLMAELADRGIGLEIMSTPAACRTYNVLVHERRRVVAALFNERGA